MDHHEPEDLAYDHLAEHLGLAANPAHPGVHYPVPVEGDSPEAEAVDAESAATAEWSADRSRLILTSPVTTFEGNTEEFAARTQSFAYQPTRAALAARSWGAVKRISDPAERRRAMDRHFDQFQPVIVAALGHGH